MATIAKADVEILVHTTAPSRGIDDARYRALAQAYLDLESDGHTNIHVSTTCEDKEVDSQLQEELLHSTQVERLSEASYKPGEDPESIPLSVLSTQQTRINGIEELEGLQSPILSFNSVLDNADSPVFRNYITPKSALESDKRPEDIQASQESWRPPPSTISDSQPDVEGQYLVPSSPTQLWETIANQTRFKENALEAGTLQGASPELPYNSIVLISTPPFAAETVPSGSDRITSSIPEAQTNVPAGYLSKQPQLLVLTQSSVGHLKRQHPGVQETIDQGSSSLGYPFTVENTMAHSASENDAKRQRIDIDDAMINRSKTSSNATGVEPPLATPKRIWTDKLEVRPPQPRASTKSLTPETLVTQLLHDTAKKMPLDVLFRPRTQSRDLRPMERGHWLIDCQSLDISLRERCWECLGNFTAKGYAGWGVWCVRDDDFESIRVYCWGIVVGHIYLLIYVASEGKIRKVDARWIGGDGQTVVQM